MRLIVIEGPDASGKSTQTRLVAEALRERGFAARRWAHRTNTRDPWRAALAYAEQRVALVAETSHTSALIVCDRWWDSTLTEGVARDLPTLCLLARAEMAALPLPVRTVMLDAPDAVLDARFAARGHVVTDLDHARRRAYRALERSYTVDTSAPEADVTAAIVRAVLLVLPRET